MLQVVEIDAIEHLEAIRLRWTSLLYDTPGASFFNTLDWLKVYWQHFRHGQRLRVLLVHRHGTVLGILPLVVREELTTTCRVNALVYPTITPSQFFGPIGPNPTATLMASFRHISSRSRDWDVLSLGEVGEHDHGRTVNALELAGLDPHETVRSKVCKVSLHSNWTDCISNRHRQVAAPQNELVYEAKPIGGLTFERIRPLGNNDDEYRRLDGIVDACCALNPHSSSCMQPAALLRDVAAIASGLGMLDLNLLWRDGRLIAFSFNVRFGDAVQQISAGATTAPFNFAPASVLSLRMVQDSILRKDRCIYFAAMNDGLANLRATEPLEVVGYQHRAAPPLRNRLTHLGRWLTSPVTNK